MERGSFSKDIPVAAFCAWMGQHHHVLRLSTIGEVPCQKSLGVALALSGSCEYAWVYTHTSALGLGTVLGVTVFQRHADHHH
jgi:hypothetical protein